MSFIEFQIHKLQQAGAALLSPASIFSLPQLAVAFAIAVVFLSLRQMRRRGGLRPSVIRRAMMRSRRILFTRSTFADLFYYFVNTFAIGGLIAWGIFSGSAVSDLCVRMLRASFGTCAPSAAPEWAVRLGITPVMFLGYEFAYFLDHYLKHKIPFLWEFHKTHHSAEVLTPLTVFRVHPIDSLIFVDIIAIVTGLFHGLFTYAAGRSISIYSIDDTNVITVAFLFLLAQLQHSQFWIPLRGLPGHILLSPAHHQIHHSLDPIHYNRNLGGFLAIFDWMFGTLCIPEKEPQRLTFGVSQQSEDPHRIQTLLLDPITNAFGVVGIRLKPARAGFGKVDRLFRSRTCSTSLK